MDKDINFTLKAGYGEYKDFNGKVGSADNQSWIDVGQRLRNGNGTITVPAGSPEAQALDRYEPLKRGSASSGSAGSDEQQEPDAGS